MGMGKSRVPRDLGDSDETNRALIFCLGLHSDTVQSAFYKVGRAES